MNIFAVDKSPLTSAESLCDQHVVKMPLESCQMLCTNLWYFSIEAPYNPAFQNHPCTMWARETASNFSWLADHALFLCIEYTRRYRKRHSCQDVVEYIHRIFWKRLVIEKPFEGNGLTPFAQAMPSQYQNDDSITAYRNYYKGEKLRFARWNFTPRPQWIG